MAGYPKSPLMMMALYLLTKKAEASLRKKEVVSQMKVSHSKTDSYPRMDQSDWYPLDPKTVTGRKTRSGQTMLKDLLSLQNLILLQVSVKADSLSNHLHA